MPIWSILPIAERPEVTLESWAVYEVPLDGDSSAWTRHFVGHSVEDHQGQVSSAVQAFDPQKGCGVTQSGRVYRLRGRPGASGDALYVWARWKSLNGIAVEGDVTKKVLEEMQASRKGAV